MIEASDALEAQPRDVLVIGYGNSLCSDDGVGWAVARRLVEDPRFAGIDVRAEHQLAPELAIDASRVSLMVLIDAAADVAPGTVRVRALDSDLRSASAWTHHLEPEDLIVLTRELWGRAPAVVVVSIGAELLDVGEVLTTTVEAAVPKAVEAVLAVICGHRASRSSGRAAGGLGAPEVGAREDGTREIRVREAGVRESAVRASSRRDA